MPRELSSDTLAAINASRTGRVFIHLLVIDHDDLGSPIRLALNNEDIVSDGETYTASSFEIVLPDARLEQIPRASIRIANIEQTIIQSLRALTSGPNITISVVSDNDLDVPEIGPYNMVLRNIIYDVLSIEGELVVAEILEEAYPSKNVTPSRFPGSF